MKAVLRSAFLILLFGLGPLTTAKADEQKTWSIDRVLGDPNAPNTIIEYSSLTCGHCASFHANVLPRLKEEWINTGKLKLIYRDFPLDHLALAAAVVTHGAPADRYFAFLNAYFHAQESWARAEDPLAAIKNIARLGGMTEKQISEALANREVLQEINARKADGARLYKIDGTPTFVINGVVHTGDLNFDDFVKRLNK